jgi:hypothetical protein
VTSERPVLLVVEQDFPDLPALTPQLIEGRYRLTTCPLEPVALEYVKESRPAAVLLDACTLYLEGPSCLERWKLASRSTRILFVDSDGPWCLLMELEDVDPGQIAIHPCRSREIALTIEDLLFRDSDVKEVRDDRLAGVAV